jgi:hypothetical protein
MEKSKIREEQIGRLLELQAKVIANEDKKDLLTVVNMVEKLNNAILYWADRW